MNPRTNMIKQDETRKLDYVDCGKSLKNLYLHLYFSYFSFIIFKMLFFIFWPLPEKLLDCPKKIILSDDSGGLQCPPPSSYAYSEIQRFIGRKFRIFRTPRVFTAPVIFPFNLAAPQLRRSCLQCTPTRERTCRIISTAHPVDMACSVQDYRIYRIYRSVYR